MRPFQAVLVGTAVMAAALAAVAISSVWGLGDACHDEVVRAVPSPDGARRALVYVRDCGAMTENHSTYVLVQARDGRRWRGEDAVFVGVGGYGVPEGRAHGLDLRVRWAGPRALEVGYPARARVVRAAARAADVPGVEVRYAADST
jgi:hypothetical protein